MAVHTPESHAPRVTVSLVSHRVNRAVAREEVETLRPHPSRLYALAVSRAPSQPGAAEPPFLNPGRTPRGDGRQGRTVKPCGVQAPSKERKETVTSVDQQSPAAFRHPEKKAKEPEGERASVLRLGSGTTRAVSAVTRCCLDRLLFAWMCHLPFGEDGKTDLQTTFWQFLLTCLRRCGATGRHT